MKKIISAFLTIAVIFVFTGCNNTEKKNEHRSETSVVIENNSDDENNISQTNSTKEVTTEEVTTEEVTTEEAMITINITISSTTFTAVLEDNDTAKALVAQLPLTVDMSELNGNEKYGYLSSNLQADTSSCPGTINEGDLMLYGDNCLVLFYKTFNTSYNYIKLGHINNTTGLTEALGSGNLQVTFSGSD